MPHTITSYRWKLHVEGKEFFNKPGAIRTAMNRELAFVDENNLYIEQSAKKENMGAYRD